MRVYTPEELAILHNTNLHSKDVALVLRISRATVHRFRKKNGIKIKIKSGHKPGARLWAVRNETRTCESPICPNEFVTKPSIPKRYCCKSCAMSNVEPWIRTDEYRQSITKPTTPAYTVYKNRVHKLSERTYTENIDLINPNRYTRTLFGVEGGYQLDHKIPIKECFERGITPEEASKIENLRILPWKENLMRQYEHRN